MSGSYLHVTTNAIVPRRPSGLLSDGERSESPKEACPELDQLRLIAGSWGFCEEAFEVVSLNVLKDEVVDCFSIALGLGKRAEICDKMRRIFLLKRFVGPAFSLEDGMTGFSNVLFSHEDDLGDYPLATIGYLAERLEAQRDKIYLTGSLS